MALITRKKSSKIFLLEKNRVKIMRTPFYHREKELKELQDAYSIPGFSGVLVYGRRRVGKSELVLESLKSFQGDILIYQCVDTTLGGNIALLRDIAQEAFPDIRFPEGSKEDFRLTLKTIFELSKKKPLAVFLDEYPYIRETEKGVDSELQSLIDSFQDYDLKLILSGSSASSMLELSSYSAPLYGRFRTKLNVEPFDYYDASSFYPNVSLQDKIRYYSCFGGIPYYIGQIDEKKTFEENVMELVLRPGSPLENEIKLTITPEFNKIAGAEEVMRLIAERKKSKYSDIHADFLQSGNKSDFDSALSKLISLGIIEKNFPLGENGNKKRQFYYIRDNLFAFYYEFAFPYATSRAILDPEVFYEKIVRRPLERSFIPKQFERITKEYVIRANKKGLFEPPFLDIGKYWYDSKNLNAEFDVVADDGRVKTFFECKFTKAQVSAFVIEEKLSQMEAMGFGGEKLVFVSSSGYGDDCKDEPVGMLTLKDLYSDALEINSKKIE